MESFENLVVWQKAMALVTKVYAATKGFPKEEIFALTSQIRRAAVSVPSKIAEGKGRLTDNDFRHFIGIARGSLLELRTEIRIAENLGYLAPDGAGELIEDANEVGRMLNGLLASLLANGSGLRANG